eukprot:66151_1
MSTSSTNYHAYLDLEIQRHQAAVLELKRIYDHYNQYLYRSFECLLAELNRKHRMELQKLFAQLQAPNNHCPVTLNHHINEQPQPPSCIDIKDLPPIHLLQPPAMVSMQSIDSPQRPLQMKITPISSASRKQHKMPVQTTTCTTETCPNGHVLRKNHQNEVRVCDRCGQECLVTYNGSVQGIECNWDLCEQCYYKPVTDAQLQLILDKLLITNDAEMFVKLPPQTQFTYYQVIQSPMALHVMQRKLSNNEYVSHTDFINDFNLIIKNCGSYNEPKSEIVETAKKLDAYFKQLIDVKHKSASNNKKKQCPECFKILAHKQALNRHLLSHRPEAEWPHACNDCNKRFKTVREMKQHQNQHTGEKPYRCSMCEKRFSNQPGLFAHDCKMKVNKTEDAT